MKQILENFRKHIQEGLTDKLFHKTTLHNFKDILQQNRFLTSVAIGTSSDKALNKGKFYYFSTARSKLGSFAKTPGVTEVMLNLDGRKLSQRYKGAAVDYWGPAFGSNSDEMEDRIITDKAEIGDAISYIEEAHINMDLKSFEFRDLFQEWIKNLQEITRFLDKVQIPYYIYTKASDWSLQRKNRSVDFKEFMKQLKDAGVEIKKSHGYTSPRRSTPSYLESIVRIVKNLIEHDKFDWLTPDEKKIVYQLKYYLRDAKAHLSNEIHNMKSQTGGREEIKSVIDLMRKLKTRTVEDFLDKISQTIKEKEDWKET